MRFFERRVRRIFPALYFVMVVTGFASWFVLMPVDFRNFGQSVVATTLFASNILFWFQDFDYFDVPSQLKPLLHTWTLAVEEQFYIIFPAIALVLGFRKRGLLIFSALSLVSLAVSQYYVAVQPSSAFYLIQSRAWELLAGVLCGMLQRRYSISQKWSTAFQYVGVGAIIGCVAFYNQTIRFPGLAAIPPVLGSALLIIGSYERRSALLTVLCSKPAVWIGRLSYSLYLWHWPILVLLRYYYVVPLSDLQSLECIALTVMFAWFSFNVVEVPFRRSQIVSTRHVAYGSAICVSLLIATGAGIHYLRGIPSRLENYAGPITETTSIDPNKMRCFLALGASGADWNADHCVVIKGASKTILWGDSFANHYVRGLKSANRNLNMTVYLLAHSSCPPIVGFSRYKDASCDAFIQTATKRIETIKPDTLILSANWESYRPEVGADQMLHQLSSTIDFFLNQGIKVVVMGQSPVFPFNSPYDFFYRMSRVGLKSDKTIDGVVYDEAFVDSLKNVSRRADYFDPESVLCDRTGCPLRRGGEFVLQDGGHFTADTSELMIRAFIKDDCQKHWDIGGVLCGQVDKQTGQ
jgi:peptidoglycan/LPS O-acetylase OafA/YrhL